MIDDEARQRLDRVRPMNLFESKLVADAVVACLGRVDDWPDPPDVEMAFRVGELVLAEWRRRYGA